MGFHNEGEEDLPATLKVRVSVDEITVVTNFRLVSEGGCSTRSTVRFASNVGGTGRIDY